MPEAAVAVSSVTPAASESPTRSAIRRGPWLVFDSIPSVVEISGERFRVHENGGGLVAMTATVARTVYVAKNARIRDRAIVVGAVRLFDQSVVEEGAIVADSCTLRGDSSVGGEAVVRGGVTLAGRARIDGDARVSGGVHLQYFAHISRGVFSGGMTVN